MRREGVCQCRPVAGISLRRVALRTATPKVSERPVECHVSVQGRRKPSVTKGGSFQEVSFRPVPLHPCRIPLQKVGNTHESAAPGLWEAVK